MTDTDEIYTPDKALVTMLADRVIAEEGPCARLSDIERLAQFDRWPETAGLDDGQTEALFTEIRDEIAARHNGKRR